MTTPNVKPITSVEAALRLAAATWDVATSMAAALHLRRTADLCRQRRDLKLLAADVERRCSR